jgi:hypothetical protein
MKTTFISANSSFRNFVFIPFNGLAVSNNGTKFIILCMKSIAEWLERLAVNAKVARLATVLGSIPVSSDTVESKGRQMKS